MTSEGKRIRFNKKEAITVTKTVERDANRLIATYGLRLALVIVRGTMERIQASYNSMEKKYGNPKDWS